VETKSIPVFTLMAKSLCEVLLTESPLQVPRDEFSPETGAIVDFWGVVRATEDGAAISGIEYETHWSMAEHQLRLVAEQARQTFGLLQIIIQHRLGFVPAEESSLLVRVGSRHRAEAFRANEWIVTELKKRAPIWKRPRFQAGQSRPGGEGQASVTAAKQRRSLAESQPKSVARLSSPA
jgi:molybdopterin synthase catalytic subunit